MKYRAAVNLNGLLRPIDLFLLGWQKKYLNFNCSSPTSYNTNSSTRFYLIKEKVKQAPNVYATL